MKKKKFQYPNGIKDYIEKVIGKRSTLSDTPFYIEKDDKKMRLETAFQWTSGTENNNFTLMLMRSKQ